MSVNPKQPNTTLPLEPVVKMWLGTLRPNDNNPPGQYVNFNTIGAIQWTHIATGDFNEELEGAFPDRKTTIHCQSAEGLLITTRRVDDDNVRITAWDIVTGVETDFIGDCSLEIKVYPTVYE